VVLVDGNVEKVPNYSDGVVRLTGFASDDVEAHLEGEDEETARRLGWWPNSSTAETVLRAERLIVNGRMRPSGLAQIEVAKADGRW